MNPSFRVQSVTTNQCRDDRAAIRFRTGLMGELRPDLADG
ncbi:hypothetical protein ATKI12_0021 [Kitasatospora sp. Ki12]